MSIDIECINARMEVVRENRRGSFTGMPNSVDMLLADAFELIAEVQRLNAALKQMDEDAKLYWRERWASERVLQARIEALQEHIVLAISHLRNGSLSSDEAINCALGELTVQP